MMNLSSIDEAVNNLQLVLNQEEYSPKNSIIITTYWDESSLTIECNSNRSTIVIEKAFFDSKDAFLMELINSIKKFSLLNIHASIEILDYTYLSNDCVLKIKSCNTFKEKVKEFTGLNKNMIYEMHMPIYGAELYFFMRPLIHDENVSRFLITSNSFNSALVNTLYAEMLNASKYFEDVYFLGKFKSSDHQILKKLVDNAVRNLLKFFDQRENNKNVDESRKIGVIDLTTGLVIETNDDEPDEETFYDINTSDIMEIDFPLANYYNSEIKGLNEGWDDRIEVEKCQTFTCDEEIMSKFMKSLFHDENIKPAPVWDENDKKSKKVQHKKIERSQSDDELQIISVESKSNYYTKGTGKWNFRDRNNVKVQNPSTTRTSLGNFGTRNRVSKPVKSKLFNDEEVQKWEKSKGSDEMSKILSKIKDFKPLNNYVDKDYKIPRKSYNTPSPRPSIHSSTKDYKPYKQEDKSNGLIKYFQNSVNNLVPYESPSGHRLTERNTPESVSNFINVDTTIHVIDDDEDDNNNNDNNNNDNNNSHSNNDKPKGPPKRKLLDITQEPKIFKNRRTDYNFDSPFSSNKGRSSTYRRKY